MQTVIETPIYLRETTKAGASEDERAAIVTFLAKHPEAGEVIRGSGGCRKVRIAGRGKGKSGGYRVITFYSGPEFPVFLLTIYRKGDLANLTDAQTNLLRSLTKELIETYRR